MAAAAQRFEPFRPWFLDYFEAVKPNGIESWRAPCPLCGGTNRRFTISAGDRQWMVN